MKSSTEHNFVFLDDRRRPVLLLTTIDGSDHHVILESVGPTVRGLCTTCFHKWRDTSTPARKARACYVLVAYLGEVNRNKRVVQGFRRQVDVLRGCNDAPVS